MHGQTSNKLAFSFSLINAWGWIYPLRICSWKVVHDLVQTHSPCWPLEWPLEFLQGNNYAYIYLQDNAYFLKKRSMRQNLWDEKEIQYPMCAMYRIFGGHYYLTFSFFSSYINLRGSRDSLILSLHTRATHEGIGSLSLQS